MTEKEKDDEEADETAAAKETKEEISKEDVEGEVITSRKGIANLFGEIYKKEYDDKEQEETEQEFGENENESSIDVHSSNSKVTMRVPEITTEELQTAIKKLKGKIPRQQRNQSRRHSSMRRWDERNGETNLQRNHKAERVHTRGMEESENKSDTQKRRCGRCWKLPPDLLIASVVQTVDDNIVRQIVSTTRPRTSGRPGRIQKLIPDNRPPCDVQNDWAEMPWVGIKMWTATIHFTKAFDSITHKSIWNALKSFGIEHDYISLLKKLQRPESISTDRRRKWHVRDQERNQTGWPSVKLALQHGTVWSTGRRHATLAKEKKVWESTWVTTTMTASQTWDLLTTCSCLHPLKISSKNVVRAQEEYWKSGTQDPSRKEKILSNQSSDTKRNWGRRHNNRNTDKRRKHEKLGPDDYFPATGDDRNQKSNQGCLGDTPQVQTGADIEKLLAQTSSPAVRRSYTSDDVLRIRNMGTHNAPTHHFNGKKIQKDCETKRRDQRRKNTNDLGSNSGESEDGQSSVFHNDQDSDVSFESDNDEEIDAAEIEE